MQSENKLGTMPISKLIWNMSLPIIASMLVQALYNIVDSVFVSRASEQALTAVSLAFPAQNLMIGLATGTAVGVNALMGRALGAGMRERADRVANNGVFLAVVGFLISAVLGLTCADLFFRSQTQVENIIRMGNDYLRIVTIGSLGMFCQVMYERLLQGTGRSMLSMYTQSLGAIINIALDPVFIFVLGMGIRGAAVATVLSQLLSAAFVVYFLRCKSEYRVQPLPLRQLPANRRCIGDIVSLGTAGFIMQLTNSVVTICCNNVLSVTGGDVYISVMTIISSMRQMVETPIYAITEGSSPIISYNYGARRPRKVLRAAVSMALMALVYTLTTWAVILLAPHFLISIFSSDPTLQADTIPAMKLYFSTFGFMLLQYVGQTVFKSLNKRRHAMFFSLLRKVIIVVPLTYLLPYAFGMGTDGVFAAEPVSNVIGGSLCFIVMLITVLPELKRMDREDAKTAK